MLVFLIKDSTVEESTGPQAFSYFCGLFDTAEPTFRGGSDVEYMQFVIQAFESEPGKWRARICRVDGAPIVVMGRRKQAEFVTALDAKTAPAAALMAMKAIDAGTFRPSRSEKSWRFRDRARKQPSPKR